MTLWMHKCLQEDFITKVWDQPVADWKVFFLCGLRRNLLHNPCAEEDRTSWHIDINGGTTGRWRASLKPMGQVFLT